MPSVSLNTWQTVRAASLDEIEAAHRAVGGLRRGRRYATQQINQAYVVLLSSQFQGFCRDLHTECVDEYVKAIPASLKVVVHRSLSRDRKIDQGNPNPGNIGADFGRFDLRFWHALTTQRRSNRTRQAALEELTILRNAIAHQDFSRLSTTTVQLQQVRRYRVSCDALARDFDLVLRQHLTAQLGLAPW